MRTKILIVPVYQKHWLYHVWTETTAAEAAERPVHWTHGASIQEKALLFGKDLNFKVNASVAKQWKSMQAAEEGTFKNRLYRLAQWVLSKEDPRETFLKSLPRQSDSLEIIHPCAFKERLVRRRLRRLALTQEHFHSRRILGWALATLPQLPLVITPFPNVTLYFTAYKMVSHYQALQGCRTLRSAFERYDREEEEQRRRRLAAEQARGGGGGILGGLGRLLPLPRRRASDDHNADSNRGSSNGAGTNSNPSPAPGALAAPLPLFHCSKALDDVVRPLDRWQTPLSDESALRLERLFHSGHPHKQQEQQKQQEQKQEEKQKHRQAPPQTAQTGRGRGGGKGEGVAAAADEGGGDDSGAGQLPELVARMRNQVVRHQLAPSAEGGGGGRKTG